MTTTGIILAVGAPNLCRDGSKTMCAIVLSEEIGLIRIYPIPAQSSFPVWSRVRIEIERSRTDSRDESYKLTNHNVFGVVSEKPEKVDVLQSCELKSGSVDPIDFQNQRFKSIALVKLEWGKTNYALHTRIPDVPQDDEECGWVSTQAAHWHKPYLMWESIQGKAHTTHLVGREVYMGIKANPQNAFRIFDNIQIANPDFEQWLLLGNMKDRRNVWVAPWIHRLKKSVGSSILPCCKIADGKPAEWPYCEQEAFNVNAVDKQQELFTIGDTISTSTRGNMAATI